MGRTAWRNLRRRAASQKLWKSRSVENQRPVFPGAWKSRPHRGIPTFPQLRRRAISTTRSNTETADRSLAHKRGHFDLLTTRSAGRSAVAPLSLRCRLTPRRAFVSLALDSVPPFPRHQGIYGTHNDASHLGTALNARGVLVWLPDPDAETVARETGEGTETA